jgi:hypothetical protein
VTAEVAIMNKLGVALAADSAATITSGAPSLKDQKIYNSANKLFTLSKYHPVGVMIFNSSDFMGVPWEVLIKLYRAHLGTDKFNTVREYADNLFSFIENHWPEPESDRFYVQTTAAQIAYEIVHKSDERVKGLIKEKGSADTVDIEKCLLETMDHILKHQEDMLKESNCTESELSQLLKKFQPLLDEVAGRIFGNRPFKINGKRKYRRITALIILLHPGVRKTGLVVAGYGEEQIYPSVLEFEVTKLFSGKVASTETTDSIVSLENSAVIAPFAQSGEVRTFLEGVGGSIKDFFQGPMKDILSSSFPSALAREAKKRLDLNDEQTLALDQMANDMGLGAYREIEHTLTQISMGKYVRPVVEMLTHLPVSELATMAETFINLESFRKKVTMNAESVGGPVDVATITKGDGFVWIKRKHYFKPELNHQFFKNYFQDNS